MVQRFLVPKFMDKNFNGYFRNTLAACFAFASEFGRLWCNFVFLDVHDVFDTWIDSFQQQTETNFSAKLRFAFFWKLHVVLQQLRWRRRMFWNLRSLRWFLERLW